MDAKELRIGNLVYHNDEIIEIKSLRPQDDDVNDEIPFHAIYGIKLTQDWLIKCGFEETKKDIFLLTAGIAVAIKNNKFFFITGNAVCELVLAELKNVHELQNIYYALQSDDLVFSDAVS